MLGNFIYVNPTKLYFGESAVTKKICHDEIVKILRESL